MENYRMERVYRICDELRGLRTRHSLPLSDWQIKDGCYITPAEADAAPSPWRPFDPKVDTWSGPDKHYWFRTSFLVPQEFDGKPLWLSIATSSRMWDAVNPQFLLFVNGVPTQGLDANHTENRLFEAAKAGESVTLDLQAYSGRDFDHNGGTTDRLKMFTSLDEIDPEINGCYYDLITPNHIVWRLPKDNENRIRLQIALEKAVNLLDLRVAYTDSFYESIRECRAFLKEEVYGKLSGAELPVATCIGHTHIDVAWWWTVEQTREKTARSFSTVLRLMEEYPDYKFMSSQPQLYKFLKERYPELYEQVRQRIAEGRWETEGGMWVEADCNLTSGESLVRQFMHGKKFFRDEFGKDNKILWLPDVFGYSAALPQIMRKSGIDYFMTTKLAWSQFNQFPNDTFWWKGIDGTEVLTHLITMQNSDQPEEGFYTTYNGNLEPVGVMRAWERYQNKDINDDVLIAYGHGDGGGGTTREMIEFGQRLATGVKGAPKVRMETSRVYFDELHDRVKDNPNTPRWAGELYLEYHRGTYTSIGRNKRANRKSEFLYEDAEFFSSFAGLVGVPYPAQTIYDSWENILLNQFHDIIPGSSIYDVYEDTKVEYAELEKRGKALIAERLDALTAAGSAKAGDMVLFNTLSFPRCDVVSVAGLPEGTKSLRDTNGKLLPVQKTADGEIAFHPSYVPAKGWASFTPSTEEVEQAPAITVEDGVIETPFYRIALDEYGQFASFYDKEAERQLLKPGEKGNVLRVYEDKPMRWDNWDIDIFYSQKHWDVTDLRSLEWVEQGPVRWVLRVERQFLDSPIVQKIIFYPDSRRIDFDTWVDWKQHQCLLKVEFAVELNAYEATYDIQFGNLKRPTHKNTSWDAARFEVCGQKWADYSERGYGVALLNDCKYGYGITEGKMTLSLIKSGTNPNPVADQEEHIFTYSLYPHLGDCCEADVHKEAYCLNVPAYAKLAQTDGSGTLPESLFTLAGEGVIVETVKQAEDGSGTILRVYEYQNRRTHASILWHTAIASAAECDLMENEIGEAAVSGERLDFTIKPFEIKTFKIRA